MTIGRPGLAREVIRLLIAIAQLATAIFTFLSGAANYDGPCSAHTYIALRYPRGTKSSSLRHKLAMRGARFKRA